MSKLVFILLMNSANVYAGVFDLFKDPATLILNQKDCMFISAPGEIADGRFIAYASRVSANIKKIDSVRISIQRTGEENEPRVLVVKKEGLYLVAYASTGQPILACSLPS